MLDLRNVALRKERLLDNDRSRWQRQDHRGKVHHFGKLRMEERLRNPSLRRIQLSLLSSTPRQPSLEWRELPPTRLSVEAKKISQADRNNNLSTLRIRQQQTVLILCRWFTLYLTLHITITLSHNRNLTPSPSLSLNPTRSLRIRHRSMATPQTTTSTPPYPFLLLHQQPLLDLRHQTRRKRPEEEEVLAAQRIQK